VNLSTLQGMRLFQSHTFVERLNAPLASWESAVKLTQTAQPATLADSSRGDWQMERQGTIRPGGIATMSRSAPSYSARSAPSYSARNAPSYSARSASTGEIQLARSAGTREAATADSPSAATATDVTEALNGFTP
jgi:hypothetical protein